MRKKTDIMKASRKILLCYLEVKATPDRSSQQKCSVKKAVLKKFRNIHRERMGMFSFKHCEIVKGTLMQIRKSPYMFVFM